MHSKPTIISAIRYPLSVIRNRLSAVHNLRSAVNGQRITDNGQRSTNNGFTLIELLVVISIIGILVAIGAVSYHKTYQLTRDSRRKADLAQIQQALESYRAENGAYPSSLNSLTPDYLNNLPTDPKTQSSYTYNQIDSYHYNLSTTLEIDGSTYTVTQP